MLPIFLFIFCLFFCSCVRVPSSSLLLPFFHSSLPTFLLSFNSHSSLFPLCFSSSFFLCLSNLLLLWIYILLVFLFDVLLPLEQLTVFSFRYFCFFSDDLSVARLLDVIIMLIWKSWRTQWVEPPLTLSPVEASSLLCKQNPGYAFQVTETPWIWRRN